jgi:hypothetical protein
MSWSAILAQCVMCYRSAAAQGAARARVFNLGIVILLIPPALILAAILYIAVRKDAPPRAASQSGAQPDIDLRSAPSQQS